MMEAGLWKGRTRKKARIHQSRERRSRFGELVQIDGSHHDWEGNRYVSEFMADYNKRFSVSAANSQDAHRPLHQEKPVLRRILSVHSQRKLSKNLEISFETKTYKIKTQTTGYRLRHKQVMIYEHTDKR